MKALSEVSAGVHSLDELLARDARFSIPEYQRNYAWTAQHLRTLLDDVTDKVCAVGGPDALLLDRIILAHEVGAGTEDVVDGQQRLTSLLIILAALRRRCRDASMRDRLGSLLVTPAGPRILLHNQAAQAVLADVLDASSPPVTRGARRLLAGYEFVEKEIDGYLKRGDITAEGYAQLLLSHVGVIVVRAPVADAHELFIRTNDRGATLSQTDRLKAVLYGLAQTPDERRRVHEGFVDIYTRLEAAGEDPDRFIRHAALAELAEDKKSLEKAIGLLRDEAAERGAGHVVDDVLLPCALALEEILAGRLPDGTPDPAMARIEGLARLSRFKGVRPALFASRRLDAQAASDIAAEIEKTTFVLSVAGVSPPQNEDAFALWARHIRLGCVSEAIAAMRSRRADHAKAFGDGFVSLGAVELADSVIRYIHDRLEAALCTVRGTHPTPMSSEHFDIEHVLAQTPNDDWARFPRPRAWVNHIANLIPFESTLNRSVQNLAYTTKLTKYALSSSWLTRSLAQDFRASMSQQRGSATGLGWHGPLGNWNEHTMRQRTSALYELACVAWDVPQVVEVTVQTTVDTTAPIELFQGRVGSVEELIRTLALIAGGVEMAAEMAPYFSGRAGSGATDRNASYRLEVLEFLGLVEDNGEKPAAFSLTDLGRQVLDAQSPTSQVATLRRLILQRFAQTPELVDILQTSELDELAPQLRVRIAVTANTYRHRQGALRALVTIAGLSQEDLESVLPPAIR